MADVIDYRFRLRRGLAAAWTASNQILLQGEFGLETDTSKVKIGDGVTAWNSLPYWPPTNLTTKGDLATFGTAPARLAAGADGQVVTADSSQALGVKWATPSAAGTLIGQTNLSLPSDFTVSIGAWRLPTNWSVDHDNLSSYTLGQDHVVVPSGVHFARATAMTCWSDSSQPRAMVVSNGGITFPVSGKHLVQDIRFNAAEALSSSQGCIVPVTPGESYFIGYNCFTAGANIGGASGSIFGHPCRIQIEWFSGYPV